MGATGSSAYHTCSYSNLYCFRVPIIVMITKKVIFAINHDLDKYLRKLAAL